MWRVGADPAMFCAFSSSTRFYDVCTSVMGRVPGLELCRLSKRLTCALLKEEQKTALLPTPGTQPPIQIWYVGNGPLSQ